MRTPTYLLADKPLPFGELAFWTADYQEFACSKSTATWLQTGGMRKVNNRNVRLEIVDECKGGHNVMVRVCPE